MILATTTVEDVERFLDVFGTKGAAYADLEALRRRNKHDQMRHGG